MKTTKYLRSVAPLVALALLAVAATAPNPPMGTALVAGPVSLNGHPVSGPSITLSSGDRLETGARGGAILFISTRDGLVVGENSGVTLVSRLDGVAAELNRGRVEVKSSHNRLRELRLPGEAVSIRAAPGTRRHYQVSRQPNATYVLARAGDISIFDEGYATHTVVPEGKTFEVRPEAEVLTPPAPAPQRPAAAGAGQRAGQISVAIPKDYIVRGPQQMEGNRGDVIQWNDLLRTEPRGRVRLALDDGSILNVGSDSRLQVLQHDNRSQQTSLQLQYGRVRAQVVRLTQPNARFEIRTNTAVCGVLGTDFYIEATEKSTRVIVFKGIVRVTPIIAGAVAGVAAGAAGQASTVGAGQASTAAAGSVSAPATATVAQVQTAMTVTTTTTTQAATVAAVAASRVPTVAATAATTGVAATAATTVVAKPSPTTP